VVIISLRYTNVSKNKFFHNIYISKFFYLDKGDIKMTDLERLKHLLEHWAEHNEEHVNTYTEWAKKAEASGNKELSEILREIAESTKKMEGLFEKAKKILK
jgi:rubrerythrin